MTNQEISAVTECPTCDGSGRCTYPSIEAQGLVVVPCPDCQTEPEEKVAVSGAERHAALLEAVAQRLWHHQVFPLDLARRYAPLVLRAVDEARQ